MLILTFFACFAISALLKKSVDMFCFVFFVGTISLYVRQRTITKMKSKLKHRVKAYLLALNNYSFLFMITVAFGLLQIVMVLLVFYRCVM